MGGGEGCGQIRRAYGGLTGEGSDDGSEACHARFVRGHGNRRRGRDGVT